MPPKAGMTQTQKLEKILAYFHESATCHTLKDLEKSIPTATKVNKMQVKDLLQELTDTNQVKVEKIGSGNWYWAWAGEELIGKRNTIDKLVEEQATLEQAILDLSSRVDKLKAEQSALQGDTQFSVVLARLTPLEDEVNQLIVVKDNWENAVTGGVEGKKDEVEKLKADAADVTNSIYALEDGLKKMAGLNTDGMNELRMKCYGDNFVDRQVLPDIDEL